MTSPNLMRPEVPLAPLTTLELGGPARTFVEVTAESEVQQALPWAAGERLAVTILGGGSNVVVADEGVAGLVLRVGLRGVSARRGPDGVAVTAAAGEPWDDLVAMAVGEGWGGIECLSGIPGTVGATPIQNVGAYGQEVADRIAAVRVLDTGTLAVRELAAEQCGFGYRTSRFRREPGRWIVLAVTIRLAAGAPATVRYDELARALGSHAAPVPLAAAREAVLHLRRSKSMVIDPGDENRRSVGSFFLNPVVTEETAAEVVRAAVEGGVAADAAEVPMFALADGRVKLSAAWLVERAGFAKGMRRGRVGISSRHSLALVHHGGGTTGELLALAREIRDGVRRRFGVELFPEPSFLGFPTADPTSSS